MRIGDFARLGNVSLRTLRFYGQAGLLRPAYVNPDNGYRHYEPAATGPAPPDPRVEGHGALSLGDSSSAPAPIDCRTIANTFPREPHCTRNQDAGRRRAAGAHRCAVACFGRQAEWCFP